MSFRSPTTLSALVALALSGCGGGSSPTAPPSRSVVANGAFSALPSSSGGSTNTVAATRTFAFTVQAGTIDAVADWSSAGNQMALALYPAGCVPGQLGFGNCLPLAQSNSNDKPSRVSLTKAQAGTYALGLINLGPGVESGTYEIGITR